MTKTYRIQRLGRRPAPIHVDLPSGLALRLPGVHGVSVYDLTSVDAEHLATLEGLKVTECTPAAAPAPTAVKLPRDKAKEKSGKAPAKRKAHPAKSAGKGKGRK